MALLFSWRLLGFVGAAALLISAIATPVQAKDMAIRYHVPPPPYNVIYDYFGKALDLALSKTVPQYGPYTLTPVEIRASNPRLNNLLEYGQEINALVAQPNHERDERFVPVRIPLDKGLLGYRVMIIRPVDAERFAAIRTMDDLKRLRFGQGFDWEDTHVLSAAGLPVEVASDRTTLLDMLACGRFQGFPRGIYEVDDEIKHYTVGCEVNLTAETTMMLHYKATKIVYVSKNDAEIARRIEDGLRMAIADGSFDKLFYSHPAITNALRQANFAGRRIFELPNARIPAEFPVNDPTLWYAPK